MLNFIKNIFSSNTISSIPFSTLYTKMIQWNESKIYPYPFNLPKAISFPESFWKDIIKIYKMTNTDNKERAISVYWVDGELLVTSVTKGDENSVTTNNNVSIKYEQHPTKNNYGRKVVYLNGKIIRKTDIYYKNIPKKIDLKYLFNMHTHPKEIINTEQIYSFFSSQDIKSLLSSQAVITGLVTNKLWILIRTNETPNQYILPENTIISIQDLKEKMKVGVYLADFNRKAIRQ